MSEYIDKSHNVTVLLYHLVFRAKYRKVIFDKQVDLQLRDVCLELEKRYQIKFLEIARDKDHVHFLIQWIPGYSVSKLVTIIKSTTAREIFIINGAIKKSLWGGEFWSDGYFASTVGKHGNEQVVANYVKKQGSQGYEKLHENRQLTLF